MTRVEPGRAAGNDAAKPRSSPASLRRGETGRTTGRQHNLLHLHIPSPDMTSSASPHLSGETAPPREAKVGRGMASVKIKVVLVLAPVCVGLCSLQLLVQLF